MSLSHPRKAITYNAFGRTHSEPRIQAVTEDNLPLRSQGVELVPPNDNNMLLTTPKEKEIVPQTPSYLHPSTIVLTYMAFGRVGGSKKLYIMTAVCIIRLVQIGQHLPMPPNVYIGPMTTTLVRHSV